MERIKILLKVMLVDDDVPVVEYMRKLIPWESLALRVCAEAYTAAEAEAQFEASLPDILITDIGLPDGNGIELARRFRAAHPELRVIFLTCHEDFHYVKEALRIEADDYVVKDELSADKMTETLRKAAARLSSELERLERTAYKSDVDRNRDILLQQFFSELSSTGNPAGMLEHGRRLGIEWSAACFAVSCFHLDIGDLCEVYNRERVELVRYAAYNIALELAVEAGLTLFPSKDHRMWVIACEREACEAQAAIERFDRQLQAKLQHYLKVRVYCIHAGEEGGLSDIGRLIERTTKRIELDYLTSGWQTAHGLPSSAGDPVKSPESGNDPETLSGKWVEALTKGERSASLLYLNHLAKAMQEAGWDAAQAKARLLRLAQEASVRLGNALPAGMQEDLGQTARLEEACRLLRWYADRLAQAAEAPYKAAPNDPDLRAINAFIEDNLYRNVTSIDVARHLHLNPSYFSRYFKKLTGMIFTDHVHLIKMEEAKRLLGQGETAENTAYLLGYSDRAYFSKVFKKYTGTSPSDYKPSPHKGEERKR